MEQLRKQMYIDLKGYYIMICKSIIMQLPEGLLPEELMWKVQSFLSHPAADLMHEQITKVKSKIHIHPQVADVSDLRGFPHKFQEVSLQPIQKIYIGLVHHSTEYDEYGNQLRTEKDILRAAEMHRRRCSKFLGKLMR